MLLLIVVKRIGVGAYPKHPSTQLPIVPKDPEIGVTTSEDGDW